MPISKLQFTPIEAAFIAGLSAKEVQKAFDEDWFDYLPHPRRGDKARRRLGPAELLHLRVVKDAGRYVVFQTEAKKVIHQQLRERMADVVLAHDDGIVVICEVKHLPDNAPPVVGRDIGLDIARVLAGAETPLEGSVRRKLEERLHGDEGSVRRHIVIDPRSKEWDRLHSWFEKMAEHLKEPVKISEISVDAASAWEQMAKRLSEATAAQVAVVSDPEIRGGEPVVRGTRIPVHLLQELVEQGATHDELLADYPSLDDQRLKLALLYAQNHPRPGRPKKRPWHVKAAV